MRKLLFILPFLLASCVTQKACFEKFPPVSTIDTIYLPREIEVPIKGAAPVIKWGGLNDTVIVKSGTAKAKAWIVHDTLFVEAVQMDSTYKIERDSLLMVVQKKDVYIKELEKTGWLTNVKHILLIIAGIFVLVIIYKIIR